MSDSPWFHSPSPPDERLQEQRLPEQEHPPLRLLEESLKKSRSEKWPNQPPPPGAGLRPSMDWLRAGVGSGEVFLTPVTLLAAEGFLIVDEEWEGWKGSAKLATSALASVFTFGFKGALESATICTSSYRCSLSRLLSSLSRCASAGVTVFNLSRESTRPQPVLGVQSCLRGF